MWAIGGCLAAAALLFEWVLAPRFLPPSGYYIRPPGEAIVQDLGHDQLPGVSGLAWSHYTLDGIRADPATPADHFRILCIGGSTTDCGLLDDHEAWPHLLQDRLRAADPSLHPWVGNAGSPGLNSRHHILIMRYVLPRFTDCDLVVHLIGVNDLLLRLSEDVNYRPMTPAEVLTDGPSLDRAFALHPTRDRDRPWYKRTNTWRLVRTSRDAIRRRHSNAAVEVKYDYPAVLAKLQGLRHDKLKPRFTLPDLDPGLAEFEQNLRYLIRQARDRGVRILLLTHPTLWGGKLSKEERYHIATGQVGGDLDHATEYYAPEALAEGMARYNEVTRRVCAETGVECLDLAAIVPNDLSSFYNDVHFNEPGGVKVSEAVAEYLLARPPFVNSEDR